MFTSMHNFWFGKTNYKLNKKYSRQLTDEEKKQLKSTEKVE